MSFTHLALAASDAASSRLWEALRNRDGGVAMTSRGHVGLSHGRESGFPPGEGGGRAGREECRIRSAAGLRGMANDGFVKKNI